MDGKLADALKTPQGFLTGSSELDAAYSDNYLQSINRSYGASTSLKLYVEPDKGTVTVYDTRGGGVPFGEGYVIGKTGYRSWGRNAIDAARSVEYLAPEEWSQEYPDFELTYTSYGYYRVDSTYRGGDEHLLETFFYFGIPTSLTDMPRTGTASYRGIADGKLYDFYQGEYDLKGEATLLADFSSGSLETSMFLKGFQPGSEIDLGSFDGAARMDGNTFRGTWIDSSAGYEGSIAGAFFGPEASEFGYSFGINKPDLTAIGGGVVVGGKNTSVPPPPPPPPPVPPPPGPPQSSFPLAEARTFQTISGSMSYTGSGPAGNITAGPASTLGQTSDRTITVTPDYATGTYTVHDGSVGTTFRLPDLFPVPNPDTRLVSLSDGGADRLVLFNNLAPGTGTNDPYLQLHYLSFAFLYDNDSTSDVHTTTALLFGTQTPLPDMPRSGTATYTTQGIASALWGYTYADVQGQLTADFSSGTISNTFSIYNYNGASVAPYYRVSGNGSIIAATPFFAGSLTGTDNPLTGSYQGAFYGPNAEEAGFTFALTGTVNGAQQSIVGAAGGKR